VTMQAVSELNPGHQLDRYELLCLLAQGGMGSVWAARRVDDQGDERIVSIKTILPKFAADRRFQEMFLREGGLAARISHRNVARIFSVGESRDILYIAMEYVDGDALSNLDRACKEKGVTIPTGIVLRILADTCAGLHCAHELGDGTGRLLNVVHRDVSPANILLTTAGVAKLIDFGIARTELSANEDTESEALKGKARYMAPEQARGDAVDRRVDIWAVGATLYDLLAGRPPYLGANPIATLQSIVSGHPPAPLPEHVHPAVAALTLTTLVHRPDRRYGSAEQLRDAIEKAMVASRLATSTTDVAAFAARFLSERAAQRRRIIEIALGTASERRRAASGPPSAVTDRRQDAHNAIAATRQSNRPTLAGVMALLLLAVVVMGLGALTTVLVAMYR
jgi:serine/threonine protein kinase